MQSLIAMRNLEENYERLRRFIVETRTALGLTQAEVSSRGGLKPGTLGNIEAGNRPSIPRQDTIEAIAKGLGIPYEVLDRVARGKTPTPDDQHSVMANMLETTSPKIRRLLLEYLASDETKRQAFEAGLIGIAQALGLDPQP